MTPTESSPCACLHDAQRSGQSVDELLTLDALAQEVGVPVQTVTRWLDAGRGPAARSCAGHGPLFERTSINHWIKHRDT